MIKGIAGIVLLLAFYVALTVLWNGISQTKHQPEPHNLDVSFEHSHHLTEGKQAVIQKLRDFEGACRHSLPAAFKDRDALRSMHVFSPLGKERLMYEPHTVCILRSVDVYRFRSDRHLPHRPFEPIIVGKRHKRVDYQAPNATFVGNDTAFLGIMEKEIALDRVKWHRSVGLLMASRFDQHAHHFIMDEAAQAISVLHHEREIAASFFEPVRVSDTVLSVVRRDDDDRLMWPVTRALIPPLLWYNSSSTFVSFDSRGSEDGHSHCYCQAVLLHGFYQRERRAYESPRPCRWSGDVRRSRRRGGDGGGGEDEFCRVMTHIRKRLVSYFGLLPFGTASSLSEFQPLGLWSWLKNTSAPRLLIEVRRGRQIGQLDEVEHIARDMGYAVQRITFDKHPHRTQFAAMRATDVFMAVHGAAFTWMIFMDTIGANSYCRSVIELLTSIPVRYLTFYVQQSGLSNVTLHRIAQERVEMHNLSRRELARVNKLAIFRNPFVGMMKNQTLFYDINAIRSALVQSLEAHRTCAS